MAKVVSTIRGPGLFSRRRSVTDLNADKTSELVADVSRAIARSAYPTAQVRQQFARQLAFDLLGYDPYPAGLRRATTVAVDTAIRLSLSELYAPVVANAAGSDPIDAFELRRELQGRLAYFAGEAEQLPVFADRLKTVFHTILRPLSRRRPATGALSIKTPLYTLFDNPVAAVDEIVRTITAFASDPSNAAKRPGTRLGDTVIANVLAASRLTFDEAQQRPYRIVWPADAKLSVDQLVAAYLADTPFESYLRTEVDLAIPDDVICQGVTVTAHSGGGKTQWLQTMVLRLFNSASPPSIIVMDSQGDAIRILSRIERLRDSVTLIDPTDIWPPALNLVPNKHEFAENLTEMQREEMLAGFIEAFKFTCEGLFGTALTPRMQLVFQYLAPWLLEIPNANLLTLIDVLRNPEPYLQYTLALSPTVQGFIQELFNERSQYRQTREHILARLHAVVGNPLFERMFAHPENKFDIAAAMNTPGSIVCINTAKAQLKADCSSLFGRFWLGRIYQATMSRAFIPPAQRPLSIVLVDEAHEYLCGAETIVEQLLQQARKYRVSFNWISQSCEQYRKAGVLPTMLGLPAVRFSGTISDADANLLAKETHTTPEFLRSVRKTDNSAEWAVFARNVTSTATKTTVPFFTAEREPKMSEPAYRAMLQRNRELVGAPRRPHTPTATTTDTPINNDGDDY